MKHDEFIDQLADAQVLSAIANAEAHTTAKIGLVVSRGRTTNAIASARRHHQALKLNQGPSRNSVLIFVAPRSQTFSIYAGSGAHTAAEQSFWDRLRDELANGFKEEQPTKALVDVIAQLGGMLAKRFPKS